MGWAFSREPLFTPTRIGIPRSFATSTTATSDLIVLLAEDGCTIEELKDKIIYDIEAKEIIQKYIDLGYGKLIAKDCFE